MKIFTLHLQAYGFLKLNRLNKILPTGFGVKLLMMVGLCLGVGKSWGQVNISGGGTYSQNFDVLGSSSSAWTDNTTLPGWYISTATLPISTGTTSSGTCVNVGIAGTNPLTDRALGCLQSSGTNQRFGLRLKNNGVTGITAFNISFTGEQWRSFNAGTLVFEYQTGATVTSLTAGTWTAFTSLDFVSLQTSGGTALDGNAPANRTAKSATLTINVVAGNEIFFRWTRNTNSSPILAVDDLSITAVAGCTPPSTQASAISATSATTNQFTANWTAGSGNGTMIVIKPAAQSTLAPSSGTAYIANTDYSLAGQINTNNRVVFRAAGTNVTTTNLSPGTQYTATAYEYNTTGDCYNTSSAPSASIYTLSLEPTAHAASFSAAAATPTSINLSFSAANTLTNASGYLILQRLGGTAPAGTPTDATGYTVGNTIGDGTIAAIVTSAAAVSSTISGLTTSTQYSYTLIPFNWDGTNAATYNYYIAATIPSATATTLSLNAPTVISPTATAITNTTATLGGNVSSDGGDAITGRGVVWAETSLNADPLILGANTTQVTTSGTTGVFTVNAPGLPVATQISYKAYAINGQGTSYTSAATFYTLANPPTLPASAIVFGAYTTNSIQLSWTNGDGVNRIVVARATAITRVSPANGTGYTANSADFGDNLNGTTGTGNVVIYNGTGSTVTVTGLAAGTSYTFDIYEYNGATVTANYGANLSGSKSTLSAEPTVQASGVNFTNVTSTAFKINWTVGNGTNSLVLVKDVTAVDSDPVDATTYTANTVFGTGTQLGTGNFVVYKSTAATVTVTGLTDGHTYYVAVYSFNGSGGTENYLTTSPGTGNQLATTISYYSQGSVDPAVLTNWNTVRAGGGSSPAAFTDGNFIIQNTHNMATTTTWSVGATGTTLEIENGGTLTANNAVTIGSTSTFKIDAGGNYIQNVGMAMGSTIFSGTEVFAPSSNIEIIIMPTGTSAPTAPGWGNLTINQTTGGTALGWSGVLSSIQGNLTILGTGTGVTRHALTAGSNVTTAIGGNLTVTGGNFWLSSAAGTCTINLTGNLVINGGTLNLGDGSGTGTINVGGDIILSSGTLTETGSSTTSKIVFNKTGSQNFTSGGTISNTVNFEVASGSITSLGTNVISGGGTVTVNNGGSLKVGSLNPSGAIAGNITSTGGLATLAAGSTIEYNGAGAQFMTARTFSNLTINNASGVSILTGAGVTVSNTLTLTSGNLTIGTNTLTLNGSVVNTSGTLTGSSTSNLTIGGTSLGQNLNFTSGARVLKNLTLSANATASLGTALDIATGVSNTSGTVTVNAGATLTTGGNLTIKSDANGTASIGNSAGTISGDVTVERWIPQRGASANGGRAYRLLTPTVSGGAINANWMEGGQVTAVGGSSNPVANYGTHITGAGGLASGFDVTQNNQASVYTTGYGPGPDLPYTALPNTTDALDAKKGYFVYIRGDRSSSLSLPYNPAGGMATTSTTLRAKGTVQQGSVSFPISTTVGDFSMVTNPFASVIDWQAVATANPNIANSYMMWDPNIGTEGGFVTVSFAGTPTPGTSAAGRYIQPGEAFMVQTVSGSSINITEAMKVAGNNNNGIFRMTPFESFQAELYLTEANNVRHSADGIMVKYDNSYSTGNDAGDFSELGNWNENIAVKRAGRRMAVEARPVILSKDTIPLFIENLRQTSYEWVFTPSMFTNIGLKAELIDNFLNTRTLLSVIDSVVVPFTVTANPASSASDRFMVVFGQFGPLAIDALTINAQAKPGGVQVNWTAKTEKDMNRYELERSFNGTTFTNIKTTAAIGNSNTAVNYSWLDANPQTGKNYYRIKAIDNTGLVKYTDIVQAGFGKTSSGIVVAPNPVSGNTINLQLTDLAKGSYTVQLFNSGGQQVFTGSFRHAGGSVNQLVEPGKGLPAGAYRLVLSSDNSRFTTMIIKN